MVHELIELIQFFKHQVSEACLLWPSKRLQPAENSTTTKKERGVRKGVLNDAIVTKKKAHFTPGTLEASL